MNLRFLGTSAATGFPNPHCRCENCVAARKAGGKSIRRMSSAMIDDDLVIDLGPDVSAACLDQRIDLADVRWVLQSHPHADHLLPMHAVARGANWAAKNAEDLTWYLSQPAIDLITSGNRRALHSLNVVIDQPEVDAHVHLATIAPWQELRFGPYRVLTIAANHDDSVQAMLFAIEKDGRQFLYGTDTTSLPAETWPEVAALGWTFDVVVFDHNDGFARAASATHMGSGAVLHEVATMRELGIFHECTRLIGTHIAHHSNSTHDVASARAQELGYEIAYDGMIVAV